MKKQYKNINVLDASIERIHSIFKEFDNVSLSFSGGKDSSVLFHLVSKVASELGRKFDVLFVDWEIQLTDTINHVHDMVELYKPIINKLWWVCVPLRTTNAASAISSEWTCWDKSKKELWCRQIPIYASTEECFPFWFDGITYEEFMPMFCAWNYGDSNSGQIIGIRTDESLNRFAAISSQKVNKWLDYHWMNHEDNYIKCYPIYDWKVTDIWRYVGINKLIYNKTYDLMNRAGVTIHQARICEPYGPEASRSLWLYHVLEPTLWNKMLSRISGTSSNGHMGAASVKYEDPPTGTTWKMQVCKLLDSLPSKSSLHYKVKISVAEQYVIKTTGNKIPDQQPYDLGGKDLTSWRRIYKMIIKNDYWCKMLSFGPTSQQHYDKYIESYKYLIEKTF